MSSDSSDTSESKRIRSFLLTLPGKSRSSKQDSTKALIVETYETLLQIKSRGYSAKDICDLLAEHGERRISPATLNLYMRQEAKRRKKIRRLSQKTECSEDLPENSGEESLSEFLSGPPEVLANPSSRNSGIKKGKKVTKIQADCQEASSFPDDSINALAEMPLEASSEPTVDVPSSRFNLSMFDRSNL